MLKDDALARQGLAEQAEPQVERPESRARPSEMCAVSMQSAAAFEVRAVTAQQRILDLEQQAAAAAAEANHLRKRLAVIEADLNALYNSSAVRFVHLVRDISPGLQKRIGGALRMLIDLVQRNSKSGVQPLRDGDVQPNEAKATAPVQCMCGGISQPLIQGGRYTTFTTDRATACLHLCEGCGHLQFFPLPTDKSLEEYYNGVFLAGSSHTIDVSREQWLGDEYLPQASFIQALERLRRQYLPELQRPSAHDMSCGFGALVERLALAGFDASGSDIDGKSIETARARGNTRVYHCHFSQVPEMFPDRFDLVTAYHCIEHFKNPIEFFRVIKRILRRGGLFVTSSPNGDYLPARLDHFAKFDWCFYPAHLHYFTPMSARILMEKAGLRVVETFSYPFDGTQTDWLMESATGRKTARLRVPDAILSALAANVLTRDLRVVATNDEAS